MTANAALSTTARGRLRQWDAGHWADWVVPVVVAALWATLLAAGAHAGTGTRRSLVFIGGPVLLLSGMHARITGYLHAHARLLLCVLPIAPAAHFAAARGRHLRGLAVTLGLGCGAVVLGSLGGDPLGAVERGLLLDWAALAVVSVGVEPLVPGVSAVFGRRFAPLSWPDKLQRKAGGGWTLPEAVVHLYAPALGIGFAALLAMPCQLWSDLAVDGAPWPAALAGVSITAVLVSVVAWFVAPLLYARGVFEAVPFVAEATRTLAGPPVPEPTPRFAARLRDPLLRLLVLQFWRETPVPMLRLGTLIAVGAWVLIAHHVQAAHAAVVIGVALLWIVPAASLARRRESLARMLSALPLSATQRQGRHLGAAALLWAPVFIGVLPLLLRLGGGW